jgi:pimeloyl-ACP methyl ester carboxylesterase
MFIKSPPPAYWYSDQDSYAYSQNATNSNFATQCEPLPLICIVDGAIQERHHSWTEVIFGALHQCSFSAAQSYIAVKKSFLNSYRQYPCNARHDVSDSYTTAVDLEGQVSHEYSVTSSFAGGDASCFYEGAGLGNGQLKGSLGPNAFKYLRPLNPDDCNLPPFQAVVLNPYFTYPMGTEVVDLAKIAREIDKPGSEPSIFATGSAVATRLAADGATRVILGVRTKNGRDPVTFTLSRPGLGALRELTPTMFSDPATGDPETLTIQPSQFIKIPAGQGSAAAALLIAPELPDDGTKFIDVTVQQGTKKEKLRIMLSPPPVLLVHGLWADPSSWTEWDRSFPRGRFPYIGKVAYPSFAAFHSPLVQKEFEGELLTARVAARQQGVVAGRVDVVAHSMGALVTRTFAKYHSGDNASLDSFKTGVIHRLISINTPHLGSPVATYLWAHRNDSVVLSLEHLGDLAQNPAAVLAFLSLRATWSSSPTLAQAMEKIGKPVRGAVQHLVPNSGGLQQLPSPVVFPYEAIGTWIDKTTGDEMLLNVLFRLSGDGTASVKGLLGNRHDVIVPFATQGFGASRVQEYSGLIHMTSPFYNALAFLSAPGVLNSHNVINYVACRLLNEPHCRKITIPASVASAQTASGRNARTSAGLDTFSLAGRTQVPDKELTLTGVPFSGLRVNNEYQASVAGTSRTVERFLYMIERPGGMDMRSAESSEAIAITPFDPSQIVVRVVAAFTDNTYATRSWTLRVAKDIKATLLEVPASQIRLAKAGSTYHLHPIAYLDAPDKGTMDVALLAQYSVVAPGQDIIVVGPDGEITALKKGQADLTIAFGGQQSTVTVVVGN